MSSAAPKPHSIKLFYMNQGGAGGDSGAVRYSDYEILCIAESAEPKHQFKVVWGSKDSLPLMSVQVHEDAGRLVIGLKDTDLTAKTVRPIVTFTVKDQVFRVVFVHLKSGNETQANAALEASVANLKTLLIDENAPVLWIGDFNRAASLAAFAKGTESIVNGGGQSHWNLDRVYTTGTWPKGVKVSAKQVSTSGDNAHAGYAITVDSSNRA